MPDSLTNVDIYNPAKRGLKSIHLFDNAEAPRGVAYDPKHYHDVQQNFHAFSKGDNPVFPVSFAVGHEEDFERGKTDTPSHGRVTAIRHDGRNLFADVPAITDEANDAINNGKIHSISPEFYQRPPDGIPRENIIAELKRRGFDVAKLEAEARAKVMEEVAEKEAAGEKVHPKTVEYMVTLELAKPLGTMLRRVNALGHEPPAQKGKVPLQLTERFTETCGGPVRYVRTEECRDAKGRGFYRAFSEIVKMTDAAGHEHDEAGRFAGGGYSRKAIDARQESKETHDFIESPSSKKALDVSEATNVNGSGGELANLHQSAANAHREAAKGHNADAKAATDVSEKQGHAFKASLHETSAKKHEDAAGEFGKGRSLKYTPETRKRIESMSELGDYVPKKMPIIAKDHPEKTQEQRLGMAYGMGKEKGLHSEGGSMWKEKMAEMEGAGAKPEDKDYLQHLGEGGADTAAFDGLQPPEEKTKALAEMCRYSDMKDEMHDPAKMYAEWDAEPEENEDEEKGKAKYAEAMGHLERFKKYTEHPARKQKYGEVQHEATKGLVPGKGDKMETSTVIDKTDDSNKFSEQQLDALIEKKVAARLKAAESTAENALARLKAKTEADKRAGLQKFCESLVTAGQLMPVQYDCKSGSGTYLDYLMALDDADKIHKFSEGGKLVPVTQLGFEMANAKARQTMFGERFKTPKGAPIQGDAEVAKVEQHYDKFSETFAKTGTTKEIFVGAFKALQKKVPDTTADAYTNMAKSGAN